MGRRSSKKGSAHPPTLRRTLHASVMHLLSKSLVTCDVHIMLQTRSIQAIPGQLRFLSMWLVTRPFTPSFSSFPSKPARIHLQLLKGLQQQACQQFGCPRILSKVKTLYPRCLQTASSVCLKLRLSRVRMQPKLQGFLPQRFFVS